MWLVGCLLLEPQAHNYCSCMLEKVIEKYSSPEEAVKLTTEEAQKTAIECLK